MWKKSVRTLLCVAILFGVVPQVVGAAQRGSLSDAEMAHYAQLQSEANNMGLLDIAGGSDDSTGTIILATIGVLVLVGAALTAAAAP